MGDFEGVEEDQRRRSDGRAQSWGSPRDREELHRLAVDAMERAGFGTCAIEVLRHDGMLEFAAIAGSPEGSAELLGRASELRYMSPAIETGRRFGALRWVPREDMSPEFQARMAVEGWVPEIPETGDEDQWYAEDMLLAVLSDEHGEVRGLLYLDEPLDGRRPTDAELAALAVRLEPSVAAAVATIERELLAHQARVSRAAREVIRSTSAEDGLGALLADAHEHLIQGFPADQLAICLYGAPTTTTETLGLPASLDRVLAQSGRRIWHSQQVLVVEPDAVWGDPGLIAEHAEALRAHVAERDLGALVMIPVGTGTEPLGGIVLTRTGRWMDSEDASALDVGHDLGRAVTLARAFEREAQLVGELQRLDAYRTDLIATISHELKNPVGVIQGHLDLLGVNEELPDPAFRSLAMMQRGADRVAALATSLLELSRLDQSQEPPSADPVALDRLLVDVAEFNEVLSTQHEVRVEVDFDEGKCQVLGDAEELRRCLANLVGNAIKYSRPGGRVWVSASRDGEDVLVTCRDEGIGISADDLPHVFDEFFRSREGEARGRPGTGLGLPIARRIVRRHLGTIGVESVLGQGTTFTVRLPAHA
ncbi:MAG TPA: HAMP domain-containing sensor histidine kinase [Nocardioides sp.]|nr:HAMP domain-containing sensor histidine kinase [Nocardioides sp.]